MAVNDPIYKTLTSFSGADLIVNFNNRVIGELQQITYAIHREKAPVYTLGSPDPRSFSRGKRGISGSLIFAVFDRDALLEELKQTAYARDWYGFTAGGNVDVYAKNRADFFQALTMTDWNEETSKTRVGTITVGGRQVKVPDGFKVLTIDQPLYADNLPPFDIVMTFANEYGNSAWQKIYGVEILNEGSGVSVDSIVMERQMTFVARKISPIITGAYTGSIKG